MKQSAQSYKPHYDWIFWVSPRLAQQGRIRSFLFFETRDTTPGFFPNSAGIKSESRFSSIPTKSAESLTGLAARLLHKVHLDWRLFCDDIALTELDGSIFDTAFGWRPSVRFNISTQNFYRFPCMVNPLHPQRLYGPFLRVYITCVNRSSVIVTL